MLYSAIFCQYFQAFYNCRHYFSLITFVENTSLYITGSLVCKQTAVVSYFMYIFIFCVLECFFFVDVIHQSCTVNYKISLDKIVGIFPNKNTYLFEEEI